MALPGNVQKKRPRRRYDEIERLYREAAFMLIGEGTSDIQKMIIGRALLKDYARKG